MINDLLNDSGGSIISAIIDQIVYLSPLFVFALPAAILFVIVPYLLFAAARELFERVTPLVTLGSMLFGLTYFLLTRAFRVGLWAFRTVRPAQTQSRHESFNGGSFHQRASGHTRRGPHSDSRTRRTHSSSGGYRDSSSSGYKSNSGARQGYGAAQSTPANDDPWTTLGLSPKVSLLEVKRAHRNLMKRYHPDLYQHLGEHELNTLKRQTQLVQTAYETIVSKMGAR